MNRQTILKFSSLNNLSDARYAAGSWADFIGFCFDPSNPAYIEPAKASEIISWVKGPLICGEFGNQPPEWILDFVKSLPLQAVQLQADYPFPEIFDRSDIKFIIQVNDPSQNINFKQADLFIASDIETGRTLQLISDKPVILEINDINDDPSPFEGIAFTGGQENKPGTRNHSDWTEYLEKWLEDGEDL